MLNFKNFNKSRSLVTCSFWLVALLSVVLCISLSCADDPTTTAAPSEETTTTTTGAPASESTTPAPGEASSTKAPGHETTHKPGDGKKKDCKDGKGGTTEAPGFYDVFADYSASRYQAPGSYHVFMHFGKRGVTNPPGGVKGGVKG